MGEAIMENFLHSRLGDHWMFHQETGVILKKWWEQGNKYNIFQFMEQNNLGTLDADLLLKRWMAVLSL